MPLKLMYITNNPEVAVIAQNAGTDRIMVDLETLQKAERQAHQDSVKSNHSISDISTIKPLLDTSELVVRINPLNEGTPDEIEQVINAGADIIMLPMYKTPDEVREFIKLVNGRASTYLLLETAEAEACLDEVLKLNGIDEIHIGLNDLHLSHNLSFMYELVANGTIEKLCNKIAKSGIPYGFGGIAKLGGGLLPAENVIAEHYRLGSSMVILARSFCNWENVSNMDEIKREFDDGVAEIRAYEKSLENKPEKFFIENKADLRKKVEAIVDGIKKAH